MKTYLTLPLGLLALAVSGCSSLPFVTRNEVRFGPFEAIGHKNVNAEGVDVSYAPDGTTRVKIAKYTSQADPTAASVALEEAKLKAQAFQSASDLNKELLEAVLAKAIAPAPAPAKTP